MALVKSSASLDPHDEAVGPGFDEAFLETAGKEVSIHSVSSSASAFKYLSGAMRSWSARESGRIEVGEVKEVLENVLSGRSERYGGQGGIFSIKNLCQSVLSMESVILAQRSDRVAESYQCKGLIQSRVNSELFNTVAAHHSDTHRVFDIMKI